MRARVRICMRTRDQNSSAIDIRIRIILQFKRVTCTSILRIRERIRNKRLIIGAGFSTHFLLNRAHDGADVVHRYLEDRRK